MENEIMHESEVIVLAIDGSDSMNGETREKVIEGCNKFIKYKKNNHVNRSSIRLIAIIFNENASIIYNGDIDGHINWKFPGGGIMLGPALNLAMECILTHIESKERAKIFIHTAG